MASLFAPVDPAPAAPVDILLVAHEPAERDVALLAFQQARLANHIHVAADGTEALDFLFPRADHSTRPGAALPGVVLLDLNLPKVPGLGVLRRIKTDERTRHIPTVVLTTSRRSDDLREALRLGADAYIVKPLDFRSLTAIASQANLSWALHGRNSHAAKASREIGSH